MKKLGPKTLAAFRNRVLNVHPALLPDFGGQGMYGIRVHEAVLAAGAKVSGPTVHLVTAGYDEGPILAQREVPVLPDDGPEALQRRVLEQEHRIYPQTLDYLSRGFIEVIEKNGRHTVIRPIRREREFENAAEAVRAAFRTPAERFGLTRENCPTHPSFAEASRLSKIADSGGVFFCAYRYPAERESGGGVSNPTGTIIGCVGIEPSRDEEGTWYLEKLAVPPAFRDAGIGTLLLEHAHNAVSELGGLRISVGIIEADDELKSWYRKRGFAEGEIREFDHLPFAVRFMAMVCG
jgi:ribosomal protein S18 acetylase RimI-like enzyme